MTISRCAQQLPLDRITEAREYLHGIYQAIVLDLFNGASDAKLKGFCQMAIDFQQSELPHDQTN